MARRTEGRNRIQLVYNIIGKWNGNEFFLGVVIVIWVSASVCCYLWKGVVVTKRRETTFPRVLVSANERRRD